MNSTTVIKSVRLSQWSERIQDQAISGLTVVDWCRQHDVSKDQFHYWKRKLKDMYVESALPEIVPVAMQPPAAMPSFLPSPSLSSSSTVTLSVNGVTIEANEFTSSELLMKVIKAARYA